jgi:hypothetical protein
VLYAKSVDGLTFKGNTLTRSYRFKPFHPRKYTFSVEYCRNVDISENIIPNDVLGKNMMIKGMKKSEIKLGKGQGISITSAQ